MDHVLTALQQPLGSYEGGKNVDDIFEWLWKTNEKLPLNDSDLIPSEKSEERAEELRSQGNLFYKNKRFEKALELYNLSIMVAPHPVMNNRDTSLYTETADEYDIFSFPRIDASRYDGFSQEESVSLAKGFSNRSAVLFELGFYKECLQDITLAEEYGIPKELMPKLEQRKDKCHKQLNGDQKSNTKETSREKIINNLESHLESSFKASLSLGQHDIKPLEEKLSKMAMKPRPPKLRRPNPSIPALSCAVKVTKTPHSGRGVVAVENIRPGDIIGVERGYFVGIDKERLVTTCCTCTKHCLTPLPCPGCSQVIFCSRSCRARGLAEDHWYDCKILPSLIALGLGYQASSYKLFKTFSYGQLRTMESELKKQKSEGAPISGFNRKGIFSSTSYEPIHHLCQVPPQKDTFIYWLTESTSLFLVAKFLEQSRRFFVDEGGEPVTVSKEDFLWTCKALFYNRIKKRQNSFCIEENHKEDDFILYPAFSLVNHSCYPAAQVINLGREAVLVAVRPISPGQEVNIAYSRAFDLQRLEERRQRLKVFDFNCRCEACEDDWPMFTELERVLYKCLNCSIVLNEKDLICPKCERMLSKEAKPTKRKKITKKIKKISNINYEVQCLSYKMIDKEPFSKKDISFILEAAELVQEGMAAPCYYYGHLKSLIIKAAATGWLWNLR